MQTKIFLKVPFKATCIPTTCVLVKHAVSDPIKGPNCSWEGPGNLYLNKEMKNKLPFNKV